MCERRISCREPEKASGARNSLPWGACSRAPEALRWGMIETQRLVLSRPRLEDMEPVCAMWADPAVTRFISPMPLDRRQGWMSVVQMAGHWDLLGYGGWIVREKGTRAFVGSMGFQRFVRGIDASREHLPEAGWVLSPAMWGRGYASEAIGAFLAWGDASLSSDVTLAIVREDNAPSLRVAAKVGYREIGRARYADSPMVLLERWRRA